MIITLIGCAGTKNVTLVHTSSVKKITTAAIAPENSNSPTMDSNIRDALLAQGVTPKANLEAETYKSTDVDAIVSCVDVWRWDLVVYLKTLTINIFDAESYNLLVSARWDASDDFGFQDAKAVVYDLIGDMFTKLNAVTKTQ